MSDKFTFTVDRILGLVRITMSGFYSQHDVADFLVARRQAHAELGLPTNAHFTLNDLRGLKIQDQATVAAFREVLSEPAMRSRRLAFVVEPNLVKMQLVRAIADRDDARCFDSVEEAEDWLFEVETLPSRLRRA